MDRPNTVSGLLEKHREIAGLVNAKRQELDRLIADLEAVTHTLRLFYPDVELPRAKPVFQGPQRVNAIRRYVVIAFREATGPLTSLEISRQVIAAQGLSENPATLVIIGKRVRAALWWLAVPIGPWLKTSLRDWAEDLLDPRRMAMEGYFDPAMIQRRWQDHLTGREDSTQALWAILMFQAWLRNQSYYRPSP